MRIHLSTIEASGAGNSLPELADDPFLIWLALARPCCLGRPFLPPSGFSCGFLYPMGEGGAGNSLPELADDIFLIRLTLTGPCPRPLSFFLRPRFRGFVSLLRLRGGGTGPRPRLASVVSAASPSHALTTADPKRGKYIADSFIILSDPVLFSFPFT